LEKPQVFIVDASVAVKWYVKEQVRDKALRLREDFVSDLIELEAPSLLLYEVGNALRHHPASTLSDCAGSVRQLRNLGIIFHELDDTLGDMAASIAFQDQVTFYDAVYLALAKRLEAKLITADKKLCDRLGEQSRSQTVLLDSYG
jgi:predicted nucleic acid-binding protein